MQFEDKQSTQVFISHPLSSPRNNWSSGLPCLHPKKEVF